MRFSLTHIGGGNKKAISPIHQTDGFYSTENFCSGSYLTPHIDLKRFALSQGTLASPSQVAAPFRVTPDAREQRTNGVGVDQDRIVS